MRVPSRRAAEFLDGIQKRVARSISQPSLTLVAVATVVVIKLSPEVASLFRSLGGACGDSKAVEASEAKAAYRRREGIKFECGNGWWRKEVCDIFASYGGHPGSLTCIIKRSEQLVRNKLKARVR